MKRWMWLVAVSIWVSACGGGDPAPAPAALPHKEKTWVKTEKVELTKKAFLEKRQETPQPVSIDLQVKHRLQQPAAAPQGQVKDRDSCLAALNPIENKRRLLQRSGGMWQVFERAPQVRPSSYIGMQIDSNFNKIIFSLRHLCATAEGMPQASLASMVSSLIKEKGEAAARQHLMDQGRAPKDIDKWFKFAKFSGKAVTRKVAYAAIEAEMRKVQPLLDLYENLSQMKVEAANQDQFLSQAATLLEEIRFHLDNDPEIILALKEDSAEPFVKLEGEM